MAGLNIMKIVYANQISVTSKATKLLNDETRKLYSLIHEIVALGQERARIPDRYFQLRPPDPDNPLGAGR